MTLVSDYMGQTPITRTIASGGLDPTSAFASDINDDGFTDVTLWVLTGNARARRFYERCGWHTDGRTQQDHRRGVVLDEVGYRRGL